MSYGTNAPIGLVPFSNGIAATWNSSPNTYDIAPGYSTSLFQGDPVANQSDGTIGIAITRFASVGVFQGCTYYDAQGNYIASPYWPSSTNTLSSMTAKAFVVDDPNTLFDIQVSTSDDTPSIQPVGLQATSIGGNADFAIGGGDFVAPYPSNPATGNPSTGLSGYYLDNANITNGPDSVAYSLKIIRLTPIIGNRFNTNASPFFFNNAIVQFNNHTYKGGTGTAGV